MFSKFLNLGNKCLIHSLWAYIVSTGHLSNGDPFIASNLIIAILMHSQTRDLMELCFSLLQNELLSSLNFQLSKFSLIFKNGIIVEECHLLNTQRSGKILENKRFDSRHCCLSHKPPLSLISRD